MLTGLINLLNRFSNLKTQDLTVSCTKKTHLKQNNSNSLKIKEMRKWKQYGRIWDPDIKGSQILWDSFNTAKIIAEHRKETTKLFL